MHFSNGDSDMNEKARSTQEMKSALIRSSVQIGPMNDGLRRHAANNDTVIVV